MVLNSISINFDLHNHVLEHPAYKIHADMLNTSSLKLEPNKRGTKRLRFW